MITDDQIHRYVRFGSGRGVHLGGARSHQIAGHFRIPTRAVRRALMRLEAAGKVKRDGRISASNDIYWEATECTA